jgi:hypothetical protein
MLEVQFKKIVVPFNLSKKLFANFVCFKKWLFPCDLQMDVCSRITLFGKFMPLGNPQKNKNPIQLVQRVFVKNMCKSHQISRIFYF